LNIIIVPGKRIKTGWFLREKEKQGVPGVPDAEIVSDQETESEDILLCRSCRSTVTSNRHTISVNSSHYHAFFNPAGIVYEIRCFSEAGGTVIHGEPTTDFTWFQGYSWQYCLCGSCLIHLGWYFSSAADSFYGLIAAKLLSE
jgi:hypothetical protein